LVKKITQRIQDEAQWAKSPKKEPVRVHFDNMALYFECRIKKKKNTPSQTVLLAILPTGRIDNYEEINMLPVLDYLSSAMQAIHE